MILRRCVFKFVLLTLNEYLILYRAIRISPFILELCVCVRVQGMLNFDRNDIICITALLKHFAGEKLLQMVKSAEKLTFYDLTIAFWQGSCVFTSFLGFAILLQIDQPS